ncbi:hypothetical protein CTZ40_42145 (plasmid) [Streptomyces rimosus]|nr:hypothetical protein CTZ40_42145 [Streptomyces rimosus]
MMSTAFFRPGAPSTGRLRPSRPTLLFNCEEFSVERRRIPATVGGLRPATAAIARSDQSGYIRTILSVAASRSLADSGSPWATFACTDCTNDSASLPSKYWTGMVSSPRSIAALTRCMPSRTRRVER